MRIKFRPNQREIRALIGMVGIDASFCLTWCVIPVLPFRLFEYTESPRSKSPPSK
jgi:hypothetical protein